MKRWSYPKKMKGLSEYGFLNPKLLQGMNGHYLIVFSSHSKLFMAKSKDGVNWSEPIYIVGEDDKKYDLFDIIQDKRGIYWLVYVVNNKEVFISSSSDGVNWGKPKRIFTAKPKRTLPPQREPFISLLKSRFLKGIMNIVGWSHILGVDLLQNKEGEHLLVLSWEDFVRSFDEPALYIMASKDGRRWRGPWSISSPKATEILCDNYEKSHIFMQDLEGTYRLFWRSEEGLWMRRATSLKEYYLGDQ
jgi:hypothetical protein